MRIVRRRKLMIKRRIEETIISAIVLGMLSGLIPMGLMTLLRNYEIARIIAQIILGCVLIELIRKMIFE